MPSTSFNVLSKIPIIERTEPAWFIDWNITKLIINKFMAFWEDISPIFHIKSANTIIKISNSCIVSPAHILDGIDFSDRFMLLEQLSSIPFLTLPSLSSILNALITLIPCINSITLSVNFICDNCLLGASLLESFIWWFTTNK